MVFDQRILVSFHEFYERWTGKMSTLRKNCIEHIMRFSKTKYKNLLYYFLDNNINFKFGETGIGISGRNDVLIVNPIDKE